MFGPAVRRLAHMEDDVPLPVLEEGGLSPSRGPASALCALDIMLLRLCQVKHPLITCGMVVHLVDGTYGPLRHSYRLRRTQQGRRQAWARSLAC